MYERFIAGIDEQIARLTQVRALLGGKKPSASVGVVAGEPGRRRMSAAARKAISRAQKKRWAKFHQERGKAA